MGRMIHLPNFKEKSNLKTEDYQRLYKEAIENPEDFWSRESKRLDWFQQWNKLQEGDFITGEIKWFLNGKLNATYNCLDRHLKTPLKNKAALIWEPDNPFEDNRIFTYQDLHREVCKFANVLKKRGLQKGDRVVLYMTMIPELAIAVLACARIGLIHSVIFGGFSADSIYDRVKDCNPKLIITADAGWRGGKIVELKSVVDKALEKGENSVETVIVYKRLGKEINWKIDRDYWWRELIHDKSISNECEIEEMDAEDPLFILYTSGSTGKPKGVLHTTAGYMLYATLTMDIVFDLKPEDTFWCTADIGWITGHTYVIYGPLSNGTTSLMFEGVPTYPDAGRFWDVVDKYQVSILYTAPTAIRALAKEGLKPIQKRKLSSLRLLGTVGEPINPESWEWYFKHIGKEKCPIVDTWWQSETGGAMICSIPGAYPEKPGSVSLPFFGVQPALLDDNGKEITETEAKGKLCIKKPWPSVTRGVYGNPKRFYDTYLSQYKGYYFTGDGAIRDKDGYYWITGRVDDVLNVSGHRIGSAEVENALVSHTSVAESAVVGYSHDIKGQGIYAYVMVKDGVITNDDLKQELINTVVKTIGKIAKPDIIHWVPNLPKTRSGKIMRRILRKIATAEFDTLGDTTTLADPSIVDKLVEDKKKYHS